MKPPFREKITAVIIDNNSTLTHFIFQFINYLQKTPKIGMFIWNYRKSKYKNGRFCSWTYPVFIQNRTIVFLIKTFIEFSCSKNNSWKSVKSQQLLKLLI